AGFHFDEDQHVPVSGDDVNFSVPRAVATFENCVPAMAELAAGVVFAPGSEVDAVGGVHGDDVRRKGRSRLRLLGGRLGWRGGEEGIAADVGGVEGVGGEADEVDVVGAQGAAHVHEAEEQQGGADDRGLLDAVPDGDATG